VQGKLQKAQEIVFLCESRCVAGFNPGSSGDGTGTLYLLLSALSFSTLPLCLPSETFVAVVSPGRETCWVPVYPGEFV